MENEENIYKKILDNLSEGVYFIDTDRNITYWNRGAEMISGYSAREVLGTSCREGILEHVDSEGNRLCGTDTCPAIRSMNQDEVVEAELYLKHKAGHRIPVLTRIAPIRGPGGDIVGAVETFYDNSPVISARQQMETYRRLALVDSLTQLGNRRHADSQLNRRLAELDRYGWPFGVLMVDIDYFKKINDEFGHDTGDSVLRMVARSAENSLRALDSLSRWGGEEFLAVLGNAQIEEVTAIAERLRRLVESSKIVRRDATIRVTVSVGGTVANSNDDADSLVKRADEHLYVCKEGGRNRVLVEA